MAARPTPVRRKSAEPRRSGEPSFVHPAALGAIPEGAAAFGGALLQTGYMLPLVKGTELLGGALLLANRFVALALVLLAPVIVNIVLFHAWLAPADSAVAGLVLALELYLAWVYRRAYSSMLAARTSPA